MLPVIDFASDQEDSLGWQLREMNHFILPHVKNAVLEAALAATQVCFFVLIVTALYSIRSVCCALLLS